MRPKRTDDKYWTGTRNFNHIQYESDLEDYIINLENETQQLRKHAVSGRSEQLKALDYLEEKGITGQQAKTIADWMEEFKSL